DVRAHAPLVLAERHLEAQLRHTEAISRALQHDPVVRVRQALAEPFEEDEPRPRLAQRLLEVRAEPRHTMPVRAPRDRRSRTLEAVTAYEVVPTLLAAQVTETRQVHRVRPVAVEILALEARHRRGRS